MHLKDRNLVLRIVKPYPEARSHVYTGNVVDYDGNMLVFDGCVLHFGRATADDPSGGLTVSKRAVRWIPTQRIEYIRELPDGLDPFGVDSLEINSDGSLVYPDMDRPDLLPD